MPLSWSFLEAVTCGLDDEVQVPTVIDDENAASLTLFVGSGSATLEVSTVWLGSLGDVGGVVSMLTAATFELDGGEGSVDCSLHVTVCAPEQDHLRIKLVKRTNVDPEGSDDVVVTPFAQSGPKFVTSNL